jgi:uncharacterized membrane protein (DUF4010 family)
MSLFFGLAFENFFAGDLPQRPGGIRTFPILALIGAAAYAVEPRSGIVLAAGLGVIGLWLFGYYRAGTGKPGDFVVPVCNVLAYLLGALALTQPAWVVVAVTVAATLLLAGRTRLHEIARKLPVAEIFTAAQFLLLVGVALPLLPDVPLAGLRELTPHRVLLAVIAVSTLSYGSYLLTRYARPKGAVLLAAALGGLYSSTATTVVLARRSRSGDTERDLAAGIVLATALTYLRLLAIIAVFNAGLGATLLPPLLALFALAAAATWIIHAFGGGDAASTPLDEPSNPLQLGAALLFALLFCVTTVATTYARARYGRLGLDTLAALVGVTDIDPFVLSIAQGTTGSRIDVAQAILIAVSSNNILKAVYASIFGSRKQMPAAVVVLVVLAAAGLTAAFFAIR